MAAKVSVRVSRYPDCAPELIEFRNRNRGTPRDRAYFDWRYLGRPCAHSPLIVWAEYEGRRVGALTLFPHDFHVLDGEYPVGVLGDISVAVDSRGLGIAGAMFRFLPEIDAVRRLYGCLVLPNTAAARPLAKSGWDDAPPIRRHAKVLDFRPRLARRLGSSCSGLLSTPLNLLARAASYEGLYRPGRYRAAIVSQPDEHFDALWQRAEKQGRIIGLRDARYLRWRYRDHPQVAYRILAVTEGTALCGYSVYRLADGICHIEDMFCANPAHHAIHVIGLLLIHLRGLQGISGISIGVTSSQVFAVLLRRFGFVRRPDHQQVMISNGASATASWSHPSAAAWHLTAGDKDV